MEGPATAVAAVTSSVTGGGSGGGVLPIVEDDQNLYDWGIEHRLGGYGGQLCLLFHIFPAKNHAAYSKQYAEVVSPLINF
jgi:hypothetical protein